MRVAHFSDSHLDFTAYRALTSDGLNMRGEDVAAAFRSAVAAILTLEPDLVIHSGDLFDVPRPSNRAIDEAMAAMQQFADARIPVVLVAGNHEVPLQRHLGSVHAPVVRVGGRAVFQGKYEAVTLPGRVVVHAIPHCLTHAAFQAELATVEPLATARHNIFVTHGSLAFLPEFKYARGNPQYVPETLFDDDRWDYIALGHFHGAMSFRGQTGRVWYAGSTERLTWNEVDHAPGFVLYDLEARAATFHALPGLRPMVDLAAIDARLAPSPAALTDLLRLALLEAVGRAERPPILRLKVEHVERAVWHHVDLRTLDDVRTKALHIEVVPAYAKDAAREAGLAEDDRPAVAALEAEWRAHAIAEGLDEALIHAGLEALRRAAA